ncbi:hypothetical protein J7E88_16355 [Streptomyces sp. ISL-10]|uniref:hypothetical protein n=1 Tax=Streptomyces sp. ISL-10 TaxID=2819172 RepID=UPI001BEA63DB|nr:hypothetical protein [Streptomyces sp. ISL-10]MBT2366839.1 hypothetical protein [Streptomyces sp. ISL-10]
MGMSDQSKDKARKSADREQQKARGGGPGKQPSKRTGQDRDKAPQRGTGPDDARDAQEAMQEALDRFNQDYDA